ncbi:MAG TPA: hypothetical protein VHR97_05810 [Candidatus Baltobacteraceae bacterium]|nr:hypothetical protein [Candidatus Baltobacteraceae bacterium]
MSTISYGRLGFAIALNVAVALAGCGGGTVPQSVSVRGAAAQSWIAPNAKSQNLLYVSDLGTNSVDALTYPKGTLVGKLTGFGSVAGLCADKAGDLFVVDEAGPVQVFAHGGTAPIRKLTTVGASDGCAVDPLTGDLALTQLSSYQYGPFAVYRKAKGEPTHYKDKDVDASWFCSYDGSGNLFGVVWDRQSKITLAELPKGGKPIRLFKLSESFKPTGIPSGIQWDGKYLAVGNRGAGSIYRLTKTGGLAQTVKLKGGDDVIQFWLQGSTLVGPNFGAGTVGLWDYPGGGSVAKALNGFTEPFGAAVSLAK